jgi:hypothetical protein
MRRDQTDPDNRFWRCFSHYLLANEFGELYPKIPLLNSRDVGPATAVALRYRTDVHVHGMLALCAKALRPFRRLFSASES